MSLDKPTAVRMYDKVKLCWDQKVKEVQGLINKATPGSPERQELERRREWMKDTEMAVIVSEEAEEEQKFDRLGLNIPPHRAQMNKTWGDDHATIEDRYREAAEPLRLVFVCAKWLTGFDAPTISTLYLDKPLQNHTLGRICFTSYIMQKVVKSESVLNLSVAALTLSASIVRSDSEENL